MTVLYSKSFWGLPLALRVYGSAVPRTLPAALVTCAYTLLLSLLARPAVSAAWGHPFAYNAFAIIVAFFLVFRCGA